MSVDPERTSLVDGHSEPELCGSGILPEVRWWSLAGFVLCSASCGPPQEPAAVARPPRATQGVMTATSVADAVKRLGDPSQPVRDAAAKSIRDAIAKDARASGDPGEQHWKTKLATIEPGIAMAEFEEATGGKGEGAVSSGQSTTAIFRLDDYWVVEAYFDEAHNLRGLGRLSRSVRHVWVEPPAKTFTGNWVTYFVNGVVSHEIEYAAGVYRRFRAYYDNAQLTYEQVYVDGKIDGPELGWHRDGKKAYEIRHARGRPVGTWTHWYPSGKLQSEEVYVDGTLDGPSIRFREDGTKSSRIDYRQGKETGQAAWDEQGTLLYAHGTASDAK